MEKITITGCRFKWNCKSPSEVVGTAAPQVMINMNNEKLKLDA
ncbi:hypothetical protein [Clostridium sp. FP1]|nr:hypothetical protein [Clostridium sp. FP1]